MELTLAHLDLPNATSQISDYGQGLDPYQAIQLHDYQSVSFFRQPAEIKASSTKIIDLFQMGAMKALMSKDSIQKMTWTSYGNTLDQYLGKDVPKEYGGNGPALEGSAWTVKYDEAAPTKTAEPQAQPQSSTTAPEATTATVAEPEPSSTVSASEPSEAVPVASSAPEVTKS
jgi:hypothetical protein